MVLLLPSIRSDRWPPSHGRPTTPDVSERVAYGVEIERLAQDALRANGAGAIRRVNGPRYDHHRYPCERSISQLRRAKLCAVHSREIQIEEDHARIGVRAEVFQRLATIGRGRDEVSGRRQRQPQQFARFGIIVDDEHRAAMGSDTVRHVDCVRKRGATWREATGLLEMNELFDG